MTPQQTADVDLCHWVKVVSATFHYSEVISLLLHILSVRSKSLSSAHTWDGQEKECPSFSGRPSIKEVLDIQATAVIFLDLWIFLRQGLTL